MIAQDDFGFMRLGQNPKIEALTLHRDILAPHFHFRLTPGDGPSVALPLHSR